MTSAISGINVQLSTAQTVAGSPASTKNDTAATTANATATPAASSESTVDTVQISMSAQIKNLNHQGETAKQIAAELGLTEDEVEQYLGVTTTTNGSGAAAQTSASAQPKPAASEQTATTGEASTSAQTPASTDSSDRSAAVLDLSGQDQLMP
jgi:hypothetical protein